MRAVTLERRTRRLVQAWTTASVVSAVAATGLALAAGGNSAWARWLLGAASVGGFVAATRHRISLHVGVLAGLAAVAVVPVDATLDRGVVAAVGGVLVLLAAECAHVARRLITIAPVTTSDRDLLALFRLAAVTGAAVAGTALVALLAEPLGRIGVGVTIATGLLVVGVWSRRRSIADGAR